MSHELEKKSLAQLNRLMRLKPEKRVQWVKEVFKWLKEKLKWAVSGEGLEKLKRLKVVADKLEEDQEKLVVAFVYAVKPEFRDDIIQVIETLEKIGKFK